MAQPTTIKFGLMRVYLGDGGSPEVFSAPCGFTQKVFNRNKSLNEVLIPDCDDPDAPVVVARDVASISFSVSGEGVLAGEAVATWNALFASNNSRNAKIELVFGGSIGTITYTGKVHLESFEITAQVGNRVLANISMQGDGAITVS